jgi:hypothetical protein
VITCRNCGQEVKSSWEQCHHCQVDLKGEKKLKFSRVNTLIKRLKNKFLLNKDEFTIRKVEVVIANFFDDYSKYGTSSVYQGKEIPYNIRVVVHASSTNKSR